MTNQANEAYQAAINETNDLILRLHVVAEAHADRQSKDPKNYGYVGDLDSVKKQIIDAIRMLDG